MTIQLSPVAYLYCMWVTILSLDSHGPSFIQMRHKAWLENPHFPDAQWRFFLTCNMSSISATFHLPRSCRVDVARDIHCTPAQTRSTWSTCMLFAFFPASVGRDAPKSRITQTIFYVRYAYCMLCFYVF